MSATTTAETTATATSRTGTSGTGASGAGMLRLVVAELRRLQSRRITLVAALVLLAAIGAYQLLVHAEAGPPGASEQAQGQAQYQEAQQSYQSGHDEYVAQCTAGGETTEQCESEYTAPQLSDYVRTPTAFDELGLTGASAYLAMLASFLVGASFIGAEYTSGSLANWLTFVPERWKVYASKAAAVVLGSALAGAVVAFSIAGLAALQVAGFGQPLTHAGHVAAGSGRVVVLAAVAGLVGFALALLTRHTVAALGFPLAYAILAAVVLAYTFNGNGALAWLPPYLPTLNLTAFVEHGTTYTQYINEMTPDGLTQTEVEKHLTFAHSAVYWLVVALIALVPSALVFRRRDVT